MICKLVEYSASKGHRVAVGLFTISLIASASFVPPQIPETQPSPRLEALLRNQTRYLVANTPSDPLENDSEPSVRSRTSTALAAATCVRLAGCVSEKSAVVRILSEITRTHRSAGGVTRNGRPWGHQWQSAFCTWQASFASWLLWEEIPADLQRAIVAMTIDEADRFLDLPPPHSQFIDTKAEENAWNSLILTFASEVLPAHPHAVRWRERGLEYMISAFATREDTRSPKKVDGRALNSWVRGANLHSDYTLENHGFVHPDYMSTVSLNLTNQLVYRLLGKPAPEACRFHAREVYENVKRLTLADGGLFYPNGTDWCIHRVDIATELHIQMDRLGGDQHAWALADLGLSTLERMQSRNRDGRTFVPGEFSSFPGHEPMAGWHYAVSLMTEKLWPPTPKPKPLHEVWRELEGGKVYEDGRFFVVRAPNSIHSFSWGARVMGLTLPFSQDSIVNPQSHSYVGLLGPPAMPDANPHRTGIGSVALHRALAADAISLRTAIPGEPFTITALAERRQGTQVFSFTVLPSGKSVFMERWGVKPSADTLAGLVSLLEEPEWVFGSRERRIEQDGKTWANVDGRLGYAVSGGGGIRVISEVRSRLLVLNSPPQAETVIVTLPGATAAETREFAAHGFRRVTSYPDACASLVDGWIVVTNFSQHPKIIDVEGVQVPVNGFSTRVVRR